MDSNQWGELKKDKARAKKLMQQAGVPGILLQLRWGSLSKAQRKKIEQAAKGKGWFEEKEEVVTSKGTETKAPKHRKVALKAQGEGAINEPIRTEPVLEDKPAPTIEPKQDKEIKKEQPDEKQSAEPVKAPWQMMRDEFIEAYYQSDKNNRTIWKGKDFTEATAKIEANKLGFGWAVEPSPYEKGRWVVVTKKDKTPFMDYKQEYGHGLIIVHKQMVKKALEEGKPVPPEVLREYELSEEPATKQQPEAKVKDTAIYDSLITRLNEAKTLKEVGDINQEATQAEVSGKITFEQLQKIYALVHEKDEYLIRKKESMIGTWKTIIESATTKEEIMDVIRETNKSELLTADQKTQFETLAKKRLYQLFKEVQRAKSDLTIVNDFKAKIEQATEIGQLQELNIEITDSITSGKFERAKVIPDDIHLLDELINDKMSRLYTERIGTTEEFAKKIPMNLIVISTEVNRLRELNKKIQASYLNQSRKDTLDLLINSKINGIYGLKPKQDVPSLDELGSFKESEAYKMLLIKISEFTTLTQLNTFSVEFNRQMQAMGIESVEDPRISDIIKLMSAKRKQLAGTQEAKIIRTPEKYEIDNLKYEAEHKPPEMLPPKEIEDVTKYSWGLTEPEAIKKYVDKERRKLQTNLDYVNKEKAALDEMIASKPHVLLTKAEIQKKYPPAEAEEKLRDLWTYKTQKSTYEKNADSARFWQSKVDKIDSGEWEKINTNYLREQYQKEVKEAIKHGKPVPFDVIKQYPEFTKAQDSRERYDKGRHTSFANVSIAVDTKHQENHGIKMKLQDGKAMEEKYADEILLMLSQYQSVVGDITPIMKRENVTIAHTKGKHPFLSTAAGMYHPTDITVTMGMKGVGAHELTHMMDETAKKRHPDQPLYNYDLIAFAKKNFNGGVYAVERALALKKSKSPEELADARELRDMLGSYWKRVEEIFARLVEQYTAYKNKGIPGTDRLHHPYELYIRTPAYWDDETFKSMIPQIEAELHRKIELAKT